MIRRPVVAGKFYPADKNSLKEAIKESFLSKLGFGKIPELGNEKLRGIIVPHAGYTYSGPCASHAYAQLPKDAKTFVILSTNHTGMGEQIAISEADQWETPLGSVNINKELIKKITEKCEFAKLDETGHRYEHSGEVQLPFLQFLYKDFSIVPITISHTTPINQLKSLANTLSKLDVVVIASSDFTHYGSSYGFTPFHGTDDEIKKKIYSLDKGIISSIQDLDIESFISKASKSTVCGVGPISLLILLSKKAELLKYYTSGDISGDYNTAVGYAAMVLK
jgi:AmmeMemoRadiSam system protein B